MGIVRYRFMYWIERTWSGMVRDSRASEAPPTEGCNVQGNLRHWLINPGRRSEGAADTYKEPHQVRRTRKMTICLAH